MKRTPYLLKQVLHFDIGDVDFPAEEHTTLKARPGCDFAT